MRVVDAMMARVVEGTVVSQVMITLMWIVGGVAWHTTAWMTHSGVKIHGREGRGGSMMMMLFVHAVVWAGMRRLLRWVMMNQGTGGGGDVMGRMHSLSQVTGMPGFRRVHGTIHFQFMEVFFFSGAGG